MKVTLSGFNMEVHENPVRTPEVLTAAYARVSRSEKTLAQLREVARANVEKARKSNESIVYDMGHASIAEHAFFNIDIEDVSRLALEELEKHRLASYTEKSQRYVKLDSDWHQPAEWVKNSQELMQLHTHAVAFYQDLLSAGVAAEDARYYLPLVVTGQVGLSCNARSAEHMILRLAASPFAEARQLAGLLFGVLKPVVPSLIRYVEPSAWILREEAAGWTLLATEETRLEENVSFLGQPVGQLQLCSPVDDWDALVLAHQAVRAGAPYAAALAGARQLSAEGRSEAFARITDGMSVHDPAPRPWEHVSLTWEWVLSAAAYAQLKRHRLAGITPAAYDPHLGFTHPAAAATDGFAARARDLVALSEATASRVEGPASVYALLSGHRRRLTWTANLRETLHFSRLREDAHAQWDIRAFAGAVSAIVREHAPHCGRIFGGKDAFAGKTLS
ncbi:MAG: thymidylate synthase (FAD) [Deltaproteobacteria bacterium HGW-Deltaproteobacteria-22]|jgi:flavin-dependent thymidylate synthase|nr:MAG: thymidylate synthase (FAD) [Deltaproteobacteria bacterium HGW-Deltaproteobacteria-22]